MSNRKGISHFVATSHQVGSSESRFFETIIVLDSGSNQKPFLTELDPVGLFVI